MLVNAHPCSCRLSEVQSTNDADGEEQESGTGNSHFFTAGMWNRALVLCWHVCTCTVVHISAYLCEHGRRRPVAVILWLAGCSHLLRPQKQKEHAYALVNATCPARLPATAATATVVSSGAHLMAVRAMDCLLGACAVAVRRMLRNGSAFPEQWLGVSRAQHVERCSGARMPEASQRSGWLCSVGAMLSCHVHAAGHHCRTAKLVVFVLGNAGACQGSSAPAMAAYIIRVHHTSTTEVPI